MASDPATLDVDPDSRAVLDQIAASGRPPLEQAGVAAARAGVAAARLVFGAPVADTEVCDVVAPGPGGDIPIRLYRPCGRDAAALPLLVFFHGGGWVLGNIESGDAFCAALAHDVGLVVAAVDYRLAPEHPFPAALDDAAAALDWLVAQGTAIGIDPDRVGVAGDSAGGTLATVCALRARDSGHPALRVQILLYPVTDLGMTSPSYQRNASGYLLTAAAMRWFRGLYLANGDPHDWRVSPLSAPRLDGVAPALIVTCGFDPLVDEGIAYVARLRDAGVPVRHLHYARQIHGFAMWGKVVRDAGALTDEVANELRRCLA